MKDMSNKIVSAALAVSLAAAPVAAHAQTFWGNGFTPAFGPSNTLAGCLLGPCAVSGIPAVVGAAIAAPILVAGGAYTAYDTARHRVGEAPIPGAVPVPQPLGKKPKYNLSLTPTASDPYYNAGDAGDRTRRPNGYLRFNDTATNIALGLGAAAIITSVIVGVAKK